MEFFITFLVLLIMLMSISKYPLHPVNMVVVYSVLYVILPRSLAIIYETFEIEYILPWGNYWQHLNVSTQSTLELIVFLIGLVIAMRLSIDPLYRSILRSIQLRQGMLVARVDKLAIVCMGLFISFLCLVFMQGTGGWEVWLTDYSNQYVSGKSGWGWLNMPLVYLSNLFAFLIGIYFFSSDERKGGGTVFLVLCVCCIALLLSAYVQGFKSRVPYFMVFIFSTFLFVRPLKRKTYFKIGFIFLIFFMIAMYFRSNGFYSTPRQLIEYMMSYFNVLPLHDMVVLDFEQGDVFTVGFAFNKWSGYFGSSVSGDYSDVSYMHTSIFFPDMWSAKATQQWPLISELYLSFPNYLFWVGSVFYIIVFLLIPVFLMRSRYSAIRTSGLFIFVSEFLRLFTVLRGGLLPWNLPFLILFYGFSLVFIIVISKKRSRNEAD